MNFFTELFFTLYGPITSALFIPLFAFFYVATSFFNRPESWVSKLFTLVFASLVLSMGITFISQMTYKIFHLSNKPASVPARRWWKLFGTLLTVCLIIGIYSLLNPTWFDASVIVGKLAATFGLAIIGVWLIGAASFFYYTFLGIKAVIKQQLPHTFSNPKLALIFKVASIIVILYPFLVTLAVLSEIFYEPLGSYHASDYFKINAAIKNTCFLDPKHEHCPHTLEEIGIVEPQAYQEMLQNAQVNYVYYPETNTYILVVRYSPVRAVIFDPRLIEKHGQDLQEYEVSLIGLDQIKGPPNFAGPWTFPDWDRPWHIN